MEREYAPGLHCRRWISLIAGGAAPAAQTVYPIDRAEILAGARFDFKVEFPRPRRPGQGRGDRERRRLRRGVRQGGGVRRARGRQGPVGSHPARRVAPEARHLSRCAPATATTPARSTWTVYDTGPRKAKNVILFIGDGMSPAHRVAARLLAEGHRRRQGARQARHRRHAAHGAGRDRRQRLHHHRFGELDERLHHRPQVGGQRHGRLRRPHARSVRRSEGRDHRQPGASAGSAWRSASSPTPRSRTRRRPRWWRTRDGAPNYDEIVEQFFAAKPDVHHGRRLGEFPAEGVPAGAKRRTRSTYIGKFRDAGYAVALTAADDGAAAARTTKLLGLFHPGNMDGALDRRFLKGGTVEEIPRPARPHRSGRAPRCRCCRARRRASS